MHELTAMAFVVELLKIVECLHERSILHLDIKPDNLLLRESNRRLEGLQIIDFGRSLDLQLLPSNCVFKGGPEWNTAVLGTQVWCYEPDRYSIAYVAHYLLLGSPLPSGPIESIVGAIRMKRYWQRLLWKRLFDQLLHSSEPVDARVRLPLENYLSSKMDTVRREMAQHAWMCAGAHM